MSLSRRFASSALALSLLGAGPALAAPQAPTGQTEAITLSPQEVEEFKLKLIQAKPNMNTVTLFSFLAPGSGQAYMGHIDRSFMFWGGYLLGFSAIKLAVPDSMVATPGGPRTSDLVVTGLFLGVATFSALDAYFLAKGERDRYDQLINRLAERTRPTP